MSIAPCLKSGQRGGRCHASSASAARVAAEAREEGGVGWGEGVCTWTWWVRGAEGSTRRGRTCLTRPARASVSDTVHVLCVPATHRAERHVPRKYTDGSRCYTERPGSHGAGSGRICVREDARIYCVGEASPRTAMRAVQYCASTPTAMSAVREAAFVRRV